ncbi:hypothetical protein KZ384_02065, partial [Glaesserella parasuis]|nr:hypothetical protein [Glaesserella parasuis]
LKAQPLFPHYYWQNRDTEQTIGPLCTSQTFEHLDDIEQFSKQSVKATTLSTTTTKACGTRLSTVASRNCNRP